MSGSAFAVTHHAFSSGAGRTSDGNGSHASTLKSPSYTKSVSWQHYPGGFANKTQNFEAVAQYQFDFGLRPSLGYVLSKGKDIEGIGDEDLVNYIDVGATYYFNKNMPAFVDYKINQLDSDNKLNINNDDIVAVGMTGNDSNLLIVFYVQIMPDDLVMQLHRF